MAAVQMAEQFEVRELALNVEAGRVTFTKAFLDVYPPGCLAVVHYSLDGVPQNLGTAIDLCKKVFLDEIEGVDIAPFADDVRKAIFRALRA
jgi:hypothetical protein